MADDLVTISELLKPNNIILKVLEFIINCDNFKLNIILALRIVLTIFVLVALDEQNFLTLKKKNQKLFEVFLNQ